MSTKLMDRIFSATQNEETEVLNQLENDVDMALEDGEVETDEYKVKKLSENSVKITDKSNGESTLAEVKDDQVNLSEIGESTRLLDEKEVEDKDLDTKIADEEVEGRSFGKKADNISIMRLGDIDWEINWDKQLAKDIDNPYNVISIKNLTMKEFMKKALDKTPAKVLSNLSEKSQKYFSTKHIEEHKDKMLMNNMSNLSKGVQDFLKKKYNIK